MSLRDQPRVFVYVIGGVADFKADPDADVCVVDGDNLATDPQYTPTVPARFADLAKHFDIPVMDEGAEAATAPQATSDAQQLRTADCSRRTTRVGPHIRQCCKGMPSSLWPAMWSSSPSAPSARK